MCMIADLPDAQPKPGKQSAEHAAIWVHDFQSRRLFSLPTSAARADSNATKPPANACACVARATSAYSCCIKTLQTAGSRKGHAGMSEWYLHRVLCCYTSDSLMCCCGGAKTCHHWSSGRLTDTHRQASLVSMMDCCPCCFTAHRSKRLALASHRKPQHEATNEPHRRQPGGDDDPLRVQTPFSHISTSVRQSSRALCWSIASQRQHG